MTCIFRDILCYQTINPILAFMNTNQFHGVYTALVTPFHNGKVDYPSLEKLVEWQIDQGISGLVPVGTTGESPTLDYDEHLEVIRTVVRVVNGRVPVYAGTGSNSTDEAIMLTRESDKIGADGVLVVAPYYNKPTQEGLFQHYSALAKVTEKPILLYSIPSRCMVEIHVDTAARLYETHPHVCCIKEAGGSVDRVSRLRQKLGDDYAILSGDDSLTLPFLSVGATGVISVASNLIIRPLQEMVSAFFAGNYQHAREIHQKYYPVFRDLFVEPNPVPVKYLLQQTGMIPSPEIRLPLTPLESTSQPLLNNLLKIIRS